MALQPFVGPWPLFQFLDLSTQSVGFLPWTGDEPVARALPAHSTAQTQNKHTSTPRVGILTHDPSV
jgi:hypothetical protein